MERGKNENRRTRKALIGKSQRDRAKDVMKEGKESETACW